MDNRKSFNSDKPSPKKPSWLKKRLPTGSAFEDVRGLLKKNRLYTVCQEAKCPNIWECFSSRTATFLILGNRCTRNCAFCAVQHGPERGTDLREPDRVADAVSRMELKYVVVTSVTRDDLADGGASVFADTIRKIREKVKDIQIEILTPDFGGNWESLETIIRAHPDVYNHNLETVKRLYPMVRPQADYRRSLELLERVKKKAPDIITKSGLMLGLGETTDEILVTLSDLLSVRCSFLTLGQYLQPTIHHLPVHHFVPPEKFDELKKTAIMMGFSEVASGPFVRSSYHARELYEALSS